MRPKGGIGGFTLVETLVALSILGAGVVALVSLQTGANRSAAAVREQMQATRHAQQAIEQARSFDSLDAFTIGSGAAGRGSPQGGPGGGSSRGPGSGVGSAPGSGSSPGAGTAAAAGFTAFDSLDDDTTVEASPSLRDGFTVTRRWTGDTAAAWQQLVVSVSWKDRLGKPGIVDLRTVLARSSPTRLAEASLQAPIDPALRPMARHGAIPPHARRLGDGTSALPWSGRSGGWLIVDDLSAEVVGACRPSLDAGTPAAAPHDPLQPCLATSGYLISGYIGVYDDPGRRAGDSAALPADLAIAFAQPQFIVGTPDCAPMVTVADAPGDVTMHPRFFICLVGPSDHDRRADTPPVWSARVELRSAAGLAGRTVCRYSKSADTTDNREHPDTYRLVATSLHNQNFVVTTPGSDCPAGTVLHQRL